MSIEFEILGTPGKDNALFVLLNSGQEVNRFLFDCGEGCLSKMSLREIQAIEQLFFSHLHIDHVSGFDSFFRCNFNRETMKNQIWGPRETARIMQFRFQGFMWNHSEDFRARWYVNEIHPSEIKQFSYEAREAFSRQHTHETKNYRDYIILEDTHYLIKAFLMDHMIDSVAYLVQEKPKLNIQVSKLKELGLTPGPWLQELKNPRVPDESDIVIGSKGYLLGKLRSNLMTETPGDSIAYLTDFRMTESAQELLAEQLKGVMTAVCESQYRHADLHLAEKHYHTTAIQVAEIAKQAGVGKLILFHLSDRYTAEEHREILEEARTVFPDTFFPDHWNI